MNRIFFQSYSSMVNSLGRRVQFSIYLKSSDGENYVWTPDLKKGAGKLFLEAYDSQVAAAPKFSGKPKSLDVEIPKPAAEQVIQSEKLKIEPDELKSLAIKLATVLCHETTYSKISNAAAAVFNFNCQTYSDSGMTNMRSQNIYDWIMTLSEQPFSMERKLELLKKFIGALASKESPLARLKEEVKQAVA